ncbi:MAG: ATP-binding protein [Roseiflexaceae bacterium]
MARRLLLSYLLIIGVTVALLVFIVHQRTEQTFSRYLSDQSLIHSRMLPLMLSSYYVENKTWDGVQKNIDEASLMIGSSVSLIDTQGRIVAATKRDMIGYTLADAPGEQIPINSSDGLLLGTIHVAPNLEQQRADQTFLDDITSALLATGVLVALVALALGALLARSINHPLSAMAQAANRMAQGDYSARVEPSGGPEIRALSQTFNQMAESVAGLEQLRRELVANVSHDLRTPLTVIRGYLEGLRSGQIADRRSAEQAFEAMHDETERLLHMVDDLRQMSRNDAGMLALQYAQVDLAALVAATVRRIIPIAEAKGIQIVLDLSPGLPPLRADPEQLGQALFNLFENSVNYTPEGGTVTIEGRMEGARVRLAVCDTGVGIAAEHLPHIFERFYRADQSRSRTGASGLGLGLSIAHAVVVAHGGELSAHSSGVPGEGSTFVISLPL